MKKLHFFLLIYTPLFAWQIVSAQELRIWGNTDGSTQYLEKIAIIDSSVVIGGYYLIPPYGHSSNLFLYDKDLNFLDSSNTYAQHGIYNVRYHFLKADSRGLFGATRFSPSNSPYYGVYCLNNQGNVVNSYYSTPAEKLTLRSVGRLNNGQFICGGLTSIGSPYSDPSYIFIDILDDTCGFQQRVNTNSLGYNIDVFPIGIDRFLSLMEVAYDTLNYPNPNVDLVLAKYNSQGQLLDTVHVNPYYVPNNFLSYNFIVRNVRLNNATQELYIRVYNRILVYDTNLVEKAVILLNQFSPYNVGLNFCFDNSGDLLLTGSMDVSQNQTEFALLKISSNGQFIRGMPIPEITGNKILDIGKFQNKIILVGQHQYSSTQAIYQNFLATLDTLGNLCHSPCVWPGDVNHDGVVNHSDALYLALAQGDSGTIRYNATLQWRQQDSRDWTASFANGANVKHADTDGDGHITLSDTLAIGQNYMQTHQKSAAGSSSGIPVWLSLDATGPAVNLHVGESQNLPLYGIAYTITLSGPAAFSGQPAMHQSGWLTAGAGQALALHKFFDNHQTLEAALARTNRADATGSGHIATIPLNLLPGSGPVMATLEFVQLVTADGAFHPAALRGDTALLSSLLEVAGEKARLDVFPIPAGDELRLSLTGSGEQLKTINLFSLDGRLLLSQQIETPQTNIVLALPPAATGTLLLEATTTTRTIYRKKVVRLR